MTLTPAFLDELRARTLLSALVGKTVKLTKAGREFKGCCPFHNEKTPSFYVNDDKGFYHCFGCSAHGDAIRWMTEQQGLPFIDAVKDLVQAAGMEMPAQDRQSVERAERAKGHHEAMADAAAFFTEQLNGIAGAEARAVLEKRGVTAKTAQAFGLGYSPDTRGRLREALKSYGDPLLIESGMLIKVDDKEPYDRFRGRLMIPIRDPRGRVIAFGGRVIGDGEPKYLNSPDTPLFDKGRTLYNLDKAAPASRKSGRVIVVEGYMDVIALAQAGFGEAVAPLGTALTEAQLERLWRLVDVPILCFDGDAAGQKAAIRAAHRALPPLLPGQSMVFVSLPPGKDPDDFVKNDGPAAFEALLSLPTPMVHVLYLSEKSSSDTVTPEARAGLRNRLQDLANSAQNQLVRQEYNRSFNDLFYEDFGWKRAERNAIGKAILKTGPHGNRELYRQYVRSALYGLYRFPRVIPQALETIYQIRLVDDGMKEWRDRLADASDRLPRLEYDGVQSIFDTRAVAPATALALQADFRFQWNIEERWAVRKLIGLVHLLHEEQEIDERMAELNAKLIADLSLDSFDTVEAERVLLREQKRALYDMGYELSVEELEQDN